MSFDTKQKKRIRGLISSCQNWDTYYFFTTLICVYTAAAAIEGTTKVRCCLVESAKQGVYAVFGLLTCASLILIYLFVVGDYSVKYVQHYSDRSMPLFYKATAMWVARMVLYCSGFGLCRFGLPSPCIKTEAIGTGHHAIYHCDNDVGDPFFMSLLITVTNPFETYMGAAPTDADSTHSCKTRTWLRIRLRFI